MSAAITRIENTGQAAQLERIAASGMLSQGCVNIIDLDAVRRGMGEKWPRRREQVWAHVDKTLETCAGEAAFFTRLNETSYLICLPDLAGAAAQSRCARILHDLLNFFLGSSTHSDIVVRNVTALNGDQIEATPIALRPDTLAPEAPAPETQATVAPPLAVPAPLLPAPSVVLSCAGPLAISFGVEQLYRIHEFSLAARRVKTSIADAAGQPITPERLNQLETSALAAIDMKSLAFATRRLGDPEFARIGVFCPISIQSLSNSRARSLILALLDAQPESARRRLVVELLNLADGTPQGRVSEVAAYLRTRVRGVFGRLNMSKEGLKSLRGASLMGTVLDTGAIGDFSKALATNILTYGELARDIAPALVAGPLPSEDFIDICGVAGVTHVTLPAQQDLVGRAVENNIPDPAPAPHGAYRLIYVSRSKLNPADGLVQALDAITRQSAQRNGQSYVTGLLIYHGGWFLQVLEGERSAVNDVVQRLMRDPRHENVQILAAHNISERAFPRWNMESMLLDPEHQLLVEAVEPGMRFDPSNLSPEAALKLLGAVGQVKDEELRTAA
jgi:Sensors of blue-light using FAD